MSCAKKLVFSLAVLAAATGGLCLSRAHAAREKVLSCVMDVTVELRDQAGAVADSETYHREFTLQQGAPFSDDFSTRTHFKVFNASVQSQGGDRTVTADWFADISVFDAVDLQTLVTLEGGDKRGKSVGQHTLFISNGSETTSYSLMVVEN